MSTDYSIKFKLHASYNEANIEKVLRRGTEKSFTYYDHVLGERYEESPVLNAKQAAKKIVDAYNDKLEGGPCVYTSFDKGSIAFIWFYKSDDGWLELYIGGFGNIKKKEYFMDFNYYIRLFLDLCVDFVIVGAEAFIDDLVYGA